ncbi:TetR family transcriptional regulator [Leucobacter coleopterorum]|nr:TetR family transcriptional regulator [Leucobacter coleopterorum]
MQDVAREAGVSIGLLAYHFGTAMVCSRQRSIT